MELYPQSKRVNTKKTEQPALDAGEHSWQQINATVYVPNQFSLTVENAGTLEAGEAEEIAAQIVANHRSAAAVPKLAQALQLAADEKDRDAQQLDEWARQSREGGWSTHQVEPMRAKADRLRREASELRAAVGQWHREKKLAAAITGDNK